MSRIVNEPYKKNLSERMEIEQIICQTYPVSDESISQLKSKLHPLKLKKKEVLLHEGARDRNFYFLREGIMRCYHNMPDREQTLWFAVGGDIFRSMRSYFHNEPAVFSIEALTDADILYIEHDDLEELFGCLLDLSNWARMLAFEELNCQEWKYERLGDGDIYAKYKAFLGMRSPEFIMQIPQKYIASYLGCTPSTLSRVRYKLLNEE